MDRRELNITSLVSGIVFIVLGALFLLERLALIDVSARYVVPVLLVALGTGILLGGSRRSRPAPETDRTEIVERPPTSE